MKNAIATTFVSSQLFSNVMPSAPHACADKSADTSVEQNNGIYQNPFLSRNTL
jgi:hypothetical protein